MPWKLDRTSKRLNIGQFSFNTFLADLFFITSDKDTTSYAKHNIEYIMANKADDLFKSLKEASIALLQWFDNNLL